MAISFQGPGDRGKGDLLFDKGKTANKQVSWNEVEVRFGAAWHCTPLWSLGGFFGDSRRSLSTCLQPERTS